ncbi:hypothetical protein GCM10010112_82020 [Actinoplanes lobatus]|uniref:Tannase/feruloyl esterase family alpha/beta hydrolase n=1 Tax=Actinoplanes lobatus TaxID=113568 RepID=A0A7W7HL90_9ACTN|nr:hypothetical protein [Actinoplanes lobatus]MBB4752616.1 hypothetical protein [Actinoplanes lobatus]GGN93588.1 hypothetical protein GCM10010112_82020 [Actinoplanes lobatus]GIE44719.1 hypothetical protein Alo02nite_76170 [Actinoplanes lobatus]
MTFEHPYVDVDEWRETPHPHRYVHGGFTGTETRFSIYFPPADRYQGRFFQHITPVPESEHLAQTATGQADKIGFAFSAGGYFLETNGGGQSGGPGSGADPTIAGFRANAAAAAHSKAVAQQVYGEHRTYGYAYGGSGGAYRTIGGAENTAGVWDGFVPYVPGSPVAAPNVFAVRMHAQRLLDGKFERIVDAFDAGGDGDPYPDLNAEQRDAFAEVTRMGFPVRSWFGHRTMGSHAFSTIYPGIVAVDPGYFTDFWTVPGYLGADPDSSVHRDRVCLTTEVTATVTRADRPELGPYAEAGQAPQGGVDEAFKGAHTGQDTVVAVRLAHAPDVTTRGAELILPSGLRLRLKGIHGDLAVLDMPDLDNAAAELIPGDTVEIDNSNLLAAQTYHRHQVPSPEYSVWDQFRAADGTPLLPQRPMQLGPMFAAGAAGTVQTGKITGKMIIVACLLDREAFPWQAAWYRDKVAEHAPDDVRLWYVDNALHGDDERQEHPAHTVSYLGVLHEALRSLADWVENGAQPAADTHYTVTDGQVTVPPAAGERGGVQPVITLTHAGDVVRAVAEVPPGAAPIVRVQWDLDGDGEYELDDVVEPTAQVVLERSHTCNGPGTRYAAVRVSAQRDGDPDTPFGRIDNVARVRVPAP